MQSGKPIRLWQGSGSICEKSQEEASARYRCEQVCDQPVRGLTVRVPQGAHIIEQLFTTPMLTFV